MAEPKQRKVEVAQDAEAIRIYIDGLPHCILLKTDFAGFCSYKQGGIYYIEVWKKKNKELLIHETRELWEEVLKQLDNVL